MEKTTLEQRQDADAAYGVYEKRQDADAAYGVYEKRQDADAAYGVYEKWAVAGQHGIELEWQRLELLLVWIW